MSFILDALKKSENERQQRSSAEFSSVPRSLGTTSAPRWLWVLGLLLAVNAAVVVGLLVRDGAPEYRAEPPPALTETVTPAPDAAAAEAGAAPAKTASFADRVAEARENLPQIPAEPAVTVQADPVADLPTGQRPPPQDSRAGDADSLLPSLGELRAEGRLQLPDLHIDLHVYSDVPARRFASINAQKVRENDTLDEGPRVREIRQDGVVLVHEGTAFILRK